MLRDHGALVPARGGPGDSRARGDGTLDDLGLVVGGWRKLPDQCWVERVGITAPEEG